MAKHLYFIGDIISLTKPRVTLMTLLVAIAGVMHASPPFLFWKTALSLLAITALVSGSCALNMYFERVQDQKMVRTMNRPIASGRLKAYWGILVGLFCTILACFLFYLSSNMLTLVCGLISLVLYVFCYTPLKQKSWLSLLIGSIPGAMPVVLGYLSLSNTLDVKAFALFSWAYLWQVPHFLAISLFREQEYTKAGFPVFSVRFSKNAAKWLLLLSSWFLVFSTAGLYATGITSTFGLFLCLSLGGLFLAICHKQAFSLPTNDWAKRAFKASLFYQTALFLVLIMGAYQ